MSLILVWVGIIIFIISLVLSMLFGLKFHDKGVISSKHPKRTTVVSLCIGTIGLTITVLGSVYINSSYFVYAWSVLFIYLIILLALIATTIDN